MNKTRVNRLSANPTNGQIHSENLLAKSSVFDYFVGLPLKELKFWANAKTNTRTNFEDYAGQFYIYFKLIFGILQKIIFSSEVHLWPCHVFTIKLFTKIVNTF